MYNETRKKELDMYELQYTDIHRFDEFMAEAEFHEVGSDEE